MTDDDTDAAGAVDDGPAYADLWARPGFLIRRLHQIHVALFLEECRAHRITPVQYAVLSVLHRGAALDQVSVAGEVGIDRNNAGDVVRRLERRGLVERFADPGDRRSRLARITPQGRRFVKDAHAAMERAQRRLTENLSGTEAARLTELMRKIMAGDDGAGQARPPSRRPGR